MKNFKLILKSLINNNACIEGGRTRPWYFAIIMFVLSMILCLVPSIVASATKKGDDFVKSSTNNYEVGVLRFVEELNKQGITLTVKEVNGQKQLIAENGELAGQAAWNAAFPNVNTQDVHCYTHINAEDKIDFQAFYFDEPINDTNWKKIAYDATYSVAEDGSEVQTLTPRKTSFICLGLDTARGVIYTSSGTAVQTSFYGDYKYFSVGYTINHLGTINVDGVDLHGDAALAKGEEVYAQYRNQSWEDWKDFFRCGFLTYKFTSLWQTNLILLGVNVGITFFMGLMLFILTRGKANPYRVYNFWETQKMVYWGTITPAVLALIVGLIPFFSQFMQVVYPLLLGVRIMWMSMKSLNPQSGAPVYPKPTKEFKEVKAKNVKTVKAR